MLLNKIISKTTTIRRNVFKFINYYDNNRLYYSTRRKIPNGFQPFTNEILNRQLNNNRSNNFILINEEINDAIVKNKPIVALESTIITHGMPYPYNINTAIKIESIIRKNGAIPSTIGIIDGIIYIGLKNEQLEWLAKQGYNGPEYNNNKDVSCRMNKISRGDLAIICQMGYSGGTTVSATSYLAHLAGIKVFVTGGIGGVHRGAEISMDISNDLMELSMTPILIVSAGIKSILDIEKTLEVLETMGVCVAVFNGNEQQDNKHGVVEFPAFYTPNSGYYVNYNYKTYKSVAELITIRDKLQLKSSILLAVPNYFEKSIQYAKKFETNLQIALNEMARNKNIKGKLVTPYLLSKMSQLTNNETLELNQKLIENNAKIGANIAVEYCKMKNENNFQNNNNNNLKIDKIPTVVGASVFDIIVKIDSPNVQLNGSTYQGSIYTTFGGVGRNIAECIQRLYGKCLLITAIGQQQQDNENEKSIVSMQNDNNNNGTRRLMNILTSSSTVLIDNMGECRLVIGDFRCNQFIDIDFVCIFYLYLNL